MSTTTHHPSSAPLSPKPALTLGAYALSPAADDAAAVAQFYAGLRELEFDAIEFPLAPSGAASLAPEWLRSHLADAWDLVVTCIPRTMTTLGTQAGYGLASTDEDGRQAALRDIAEVRDLAVRLADENGRPRVRAIEVHSAPGPHGANPRGGAPGAREAFARSLTEIASWQIPGAQIVVEHNDALIPGQPWAKGFFSLADEIAVVNEVLASGAPGTTLADGRPALGMSINWGRSAIEGRSAATATEHTALAAAAGLLRGVIFSGATDVDSAWGAAWGDAHIAPRGENAAFEVSSASLLDTDAIAATLAAAGEAPLDFVGMKVTTQPTTADVDARLAVARASLELLRS